MLLGNLKRLIPRQTDNQISVGESMPPDIKDEKSLHVPGDPPPYTAVAAQPPDRDPIATLRGYNTGHTAAASSSTHTCTQDISIIITLKHHKPSPLQNSTGSKIERSAPFRKEVADAMLLCGSDCTFYATLRRIQVRAVLRLGLESLSVAETMGRLMYHPSHPTPPSDSKGRDGGEKAKARDGSVKMKGKVDVAVLVDACNWEAVKLILVRGRGDLVFEVVDVPKGWSVC